jgi:hypothetical protein
MLLSSTLPTYAILEPKIRAWATHRRILLSPDGRPLLGTTQGQYRKTLEEIGEAQLERRKLAKSKALRLQLFPLGLIVEGEGVLDRRFALIALEFGDVLVTLTILAAMHGATLEACLRQPNGTVQNWQFVDQHAAELGERLEENSVKIPTAIGAVARCVEDEARILLELSGPKCLALALAKIEGRDGTMVDGVFVKDAVTVGP